MLTLTLAFILVLLLLYVLGVPVAYAIGLSAIVVMVLPVGPDFNAQVIAQRMYTGMNSFTLLAIPFFLFAGRIMNVIGMTSDIFDFAEEAVGPLPGGLGHVNVVVSMIFSGMSGAAVADAAGLGTIEYEAMTDRGYEPGFSAGITAASSTIGPIIPPSIPMIVYGVMAQVSIGALFIAGVIPGILMGVSLMGMVTYIAIREGFASRNAYNARKLLGTLVRAAPAFVAPVIIIGGIISGYFTPTESAVVAVMYATFLGAFYYRSLDGETLYAVIKKTFIDTAALILIIGLANLYGFLVTISGVPRYLTETLLTVADTAIVATLLLVVVLLVFGTFMETLAIILITVPILAPTFPGLGIDPLVFGIVMMITLMIGLITPPFGVVLFVLERVTNLDLLDIIRGVGPFYIPLFAVLLLVIFVPDVVLFLPRMFGFA
ncbi:TRAP transporter large permease [Halomarina halobia]|uniref:TRAP transporter large permease n=1 Tax=Halomarina halobia TaxID=3033386 RepID=A0ABD6AF24_9EURY|nr:TRAP transporter large permease [Halomarina sp. PSR21]